MSEMVVIHQKSNFEINFQASDPENPESEELHEVTSIFAMTPYTMLLASLGACTTIVLHTYAQHHGIDLQSVEAIVEYERDFKEDCKNCDQIERYEEHIKESVTFKGDFSADEKKRLDQIAKRCSIHKILEDGIKIVHPTD
jgi:uncharacterized OsmC-like protein